MRYADITELVSLNQDARAYFESLSNDTQKALLAHGSGINTLEELKNFSLVVKRQG